MKKRSKPVRNKNGLSSLAKNVVGFIQEKFGDEAAVSLSDPMYPSTIHYGIPSGCLMIDYAIGRPGIPVGRIVEISGLDGSGKSTMALHMEAETQKMGGVVVLAETEGAIDTLRAKRIGIREDLIVPINPESIEQGFEMSIEAVKEIRNTLPLEKPILIVWDSVAEFTTDAEDEGDFGDSSMGIHARKLAQGFRKLKFFLPRTYSTLLIVNQLKASMKQFGDEYRTFGGKAIHYRASLRLRIHALGKSKMIKDDDGSPLAMPCSISIVKNKVQVPFREAEVLLNFSKGFDRYDDLLKAAQAFGVVKLKKPWFYFDKHKFQKRDWPVLIKDVFGTTRKARSYLYDVAIQTGKLMPYGSDKEIKAWEKMVENKGHAPEVKRE